LGVAGFRGIVQSRIGGSEVKRRRFTMAEYKEGPSQRCRSRFRPSFGPQYPICNAWKLRTRLLYRANAPRKGTTRV
jgi:hypothetical protein